MTGCSNFDSSVDTLSPPYVMRIDSFDGVTVRGAIYGVFDAPLAPATGTAPVSGEVTFEFPAEIQ